MTSARRMRFEKGLLKVGEIAEEAGVRPSTVRFYTQVGLLEPISYTKGGHKLYERKTTIRKIILIKQMTTPKFQLADLKI